MGGRKPSMGRQKIEIKKIKNKEAREVCFSKRRASLFKKASEISILCGAEIGVVVNSSARNAFSFGHPSVEKVADGFLTGSLSAFGMEGFTDPFELYRNNKIYELSYQYTELSNSLEDKKNERDMLLAALESAKEGLNHGWDENMEELGLEELEQMDELMKDFDKSVFIENPTDVDDPFTTLSLRPPGFEYE